MFAVVVLGMDGEIAKVLGRFDDESYARIFYQYGLKHWPKMALRLVEASETARFIHSYNTRPMGTDNPPQKV